jgi:hypothetical protein
MPKIFSFINGIEHKFDDRNLSDAKSDAINIISQIASGFIRDNGLDEITQQNAALGIYEPERCEAIKNYIAACRNEYLRCKALILAATTNDEADSVTFIAPPVPENL